MRSARVHRFAGSLALLATFVVGQAAELLHFASVDHRTCPEHGEMVDVVHRARTFEVHTVSDPGVLPGKERRASDEDAHCPFSLLATARVNVDQRHAVEPEPPRTAIVSIARTTGVRSRLFVLRLAPKQSPPTLA